MIRQNYKIQKVHRTKERIWQILIAILFAVFAAFLIFSNIKLRAQREQIKERIKELSANIEKLRQEKTFFEAKISDISDPDYLEKEAREKFNLKKPGEEVVVILNPESQTTQQNQPQKKENELENASQNLLYRIKKFFGW